MQERRVLYLKEAEEGDGEERKNRTRVDACDEKGQGQTQEKR